MHNRSQPSLAMVQCVRDEEEFIGANLAYHHRLGVRRAYLFLDRCTDATERIARSFPWVDVCQRPRTAHDEFLGTYLARCADMALAKARAEGFDWLLHVDADEFASGDDRPDLVRWMAMRLPARRDRPSEGVGSLTAMLSRVQPRTEMVVLPTREVVPQVLPPDAPFWKLEHFQIRGAMRRRLLDPGTGEIREIRHWLGHELGKSIVRTAADVCAVNSHSWRRRQGTTALLSEQHGFHYHYVLVSAAHWLKKYRRLAEYPDHWERDGGAVRFPKQAWKLAAPRFSPAEAAAYYEKWVALPSHALGSHPLGHWIMRDTFVADVLARTSIADSQATRPTDTAGGPSLD